MKTLRHFVLATLVVAAPVGAAEPLALVGGGTSGLAGAFRTIYATGLGEGHAEVGLHLDYATASEVFADTGGNRLGYRLTAGIPVWGPLEVGLDLRGVRAATTDMAEDFTFSSFGDIGLAVKGSHAFRPDLRLGAAAGYDLMQGVEGQSTVGDTATPWIAILAGWFGDAGAAAIPLRAHLHAGYRHDRTINFLGAKRLPADLERWAWGMYDDVRAELRLAVESPLGMFLPLIEYELEMPLADGVATDRLVHTVTPGLKARVAEGLLVGAGVDVAFGDRGDFGPALMPWTARLGVTWRIGGDVPVAVRAEREAAPAMPEAAPADLTAPTDLSAPTDLTGPAEITAPASLTAPTSGTAPTNTGGALPAESPTSAGRTPPPDAKPAEGAVDLDSYELR